MPSESVSCSQDKRERIVVADDGGTAVDWNDHAKREEQGLSEAMPTDGTKCIACGCGDK